MDCDTLSKAFQNAILITRRLGIRFLWIDSICIIQDGDEGKDWVSEAVKMGQYYQNSILTIAITTSSPHDDFLSPRPHKPFLSLARLPYRGMSGIQRGYFYVYKRERPVDEQFLSGVWNSELLRRGWVFQEWLLSRRIAYFTPSQIFFECQTEPPRTECEDTIELPSLPPNLNKGFSLKTNLIFTPSSIENTWYQILEIYSRLSFTIIEKDRIIALSGVANEVRETFILNDSQSKERKQLEYVSGLWLRDIHYGLLWQQKRAPKEYLRISGIPSWSWASLQLEVKWFKRRRGAVNAFKVVSLISANRVTYPIEPLDERPASLSPSLSIRLDGMSTVLERYDVDNLFTSIHITARLQAVLVRGIFQTKQDIRLAAWASGVDIEDDDLKQWAKDLQAGYIDPATWQMALGLDFEARPWKAICSVRAPDVVGGWGSFEKNEHSNSSNISLDTRVCAIHVSTETGVPGGLAFGLLSLTHDVYNVLFVENVGGIQYRRVGVGKLFEKDMLRGFSRAKLQDIELV